MKKNVAFLYTIIAVFLMLIFLIGLYKPVTTTFFDYDMYYFIAPSEFQIFTNNTFLKTLLIHLFDPYQMLMYDPLSCVYFFVNFLLFGPHEDSIPHRALEQNGKNSTGCEYANFCYGSKDVYLSFNVTRSENIKYSQLVFKHNKKYNGIFGDYRYDFYFPNENKYIEVTSYNKGYFKKHHERQFNYLMNIVIKRKFVTLVFIA